MIVYSILPLNSQSSIRHIEAGDRDLKSSQVYPWEFAYKVSQLEPRHFGKLNSPQKLFFEKGFPFRLWGLLLNVGVS